MGYVIVATRRKYVQEVLESAEGQGQESSDYMREQENEESSSGIVSAEEEQSGPQLENESLIPTLKGNKGQIRNLRKKWRRKN